MALVSRTAAGLILAAPVMAALGLSLTPGVAAASLRAAEPPATAAKQVEGSKQDTLIFKDGRVVTGTIVSETATSVKFKGAVSGIAFETEYPKTDILSMTRGVKTDAKAADAPSKAGVDAGGSKSAPKDPPADAGEATRVYFVDLNGKFGEDISQTPIRQAFKDAKSNNADYIIVTLNNDWNDGSGFGELPNDAGAFDEIFRANEMEEVFNNELKRDWAKPPQLVFYVKQAMGGACMLPLLCNTIYFAPEGRMGGIGNLSEILSNFDEVVRQKQISLRIAQAKGLAIVGGYDPRIVDAMSKTEFVLSYTFENGKVKFLEAAPSGPNEYLLTDDGKDPNKDDIKALARGEGNDVLTLTPDIAQKIGVSKGTESNIDDLLFDLGIGRNAVKIEGRSKFIMDGWKRSVEQAKRQLKTLHEEFGQIQVSGPTYNDRTRQRGMQKAKLNDILSIYKRMGEGLSPSWRGRNRMMPEAQILTILAEIDLQQAQDKK